MTSNPAVTGWPSDKVAQPERSIRNGIFGRNAAVSYGIDPSAKLQALSCDQLETAREEYRAAPFGSNAMHGPRIRRELLAMLRRDPWWGGAGAYQSSRNSIYPRK
jgi:hypothetical protein